MSRHHGASKQQLRRGCGKRRSGKLAGKRLGPCRTTTKGGKFSKHGRYYRCPKPGGGWTKPKKRSRKK